MLAGELIRVAGLSVCYGGSVGEHRGAGEWLVGFWVGVGGGDGCERVWWPGWWLVLGEMEGGSGEGCGCGTMRLICLQRQSLRRCGNEVVAVCVGVREGYGERQIRKVLGRTGQGKAEQNRAE